MNLQFYLEKLHDLDEFQEFMVENPDAYLCSCFFDVNYSEKSSADKQHMDFYSPKEKQIFSFKLEENVKEPLENFNNEAPKKLSLDYDFDFDDLGKIISGKMAEKNIKNTIQKFLISLQKVENEDKIVATVFISGMGILKIVIEPVSKKVLEFEKKSFFEMVKFLGKGGN